MSTRYRKMRLTSSRHIDGPQGWARLGVPLSPCSTASGASLRKEKALDTLRGRHCNEHVSSSAGHHAQVTALR